MNRTVFVGGSRSLTVASATVAAWLGRELAQHDFSLAVGCAPGADAAVLSSFLAAPDVSPARASVFAVGAPSGAGFPRWSLPPAVAAAAALGCPVSWLAGGPLSIPLRARLVRRARAAVAAADLAAVLVLSSPASRGSLLAGAAAAALGLPVFVLAAGFPAAAVPALPGQAGAWSPSSLFARPCLSWQPAQAALL